MAIVVMPPIALANGAMGLGLEQWDPTYWLVYVLTMVAFEAWYIGKWLGMSLPKAIFVSACANSVTGLGCGLGGCCAPFLHYRVVGTSGNPNPLMSAVALLALFALPSAYLESLIWHHTHRFGWNHAKGRWQTLGRVTAAHLLSIPLGLVILLIPERPYLGMEAWASYERRMELRTIAEELNDYVGRNERLPQATTVPQLLKEVRARKSTGAVRHRGVALYTPDFRRFDLGEAGRHPYRLNAALAGRTLPLEDDWAKKRFIWYLEPSFVDNRWSAPWGIGFDSETGEFHMARYPEGGKGF